MAKTIAKKKTGAHASRKPLGLEAEQAGEVALLEDESGHAERGADREQVGGDADRGEDGRLQRDEQQ